MPLYRQRQTLCIYSPSGGIFLREMTSWPPSRNCEVRLKIQLSQLMCICLKNDPVKFHPNLI